MESSLDPMPISQEDTTKFVRALQDKMDLSLIDQSSGALLLKEGAEDLEVHVIPIKISGRTPRIEEYGTARGLEGEGIMQVVHRKRAMQKDFASDVVKVLETIDLDKFYGLNRYTKYGIRRAKDRPSTSSVEMAAKGPPKGIVGRLNIPKSHQLITSIYDLIVSVNILKLYQPTAAAAANMHPR